METFRILIVEDEADMRTIMRASLEPRYEVAEAVNGLDGLEKLERVQPDLIILDIMMPLMDGFEACRAIRNHPGYRDVPVLFLSALGEMDALKAGYGAGANFFITKPFEPDHLLKTVDFFFERRNTAPKPKQYSVQDLNQLDWKGIVPRGESGEGAKPAASAAAAVARVLVVTGDAQTLHSASDALREDFDVISARSSAEAIANLILLRPDLLLLDTALPDQKAWSICRLVRQNATYGEMPIVFLADKRTRPEKCAEAGGDATVARPIDADALRSTMLECTRKPGFRIRPKEMTTEIHFPQE